ncbi:MAG: prolipoprotein diacylglyceryl transferase [Haliangiales bacterium]
MEHAGIPYFTVPELWIFKPFGLLVATGVIVGARLVQRRAARKGLSEDHARQIVMWVVGFGIVGAHVIDVLAYQPGVLSRDPLALFKLWAGLSSFGGFIGGVLGFVLYTRRHKLSFGLWGDTAFWGFVPGFAFGRLGCTIVHDHIGRATDFPLAQNYTAQVVAEHGYRIEPGLHHNLGMYEFGFMLLLCAIMWLLDRKPRPSGLLVATVITLYAPVRLLMDFLRLENSDPRYVGLTFAQWMSVLMFTIGAVWVVRLLVKPTAVVPDVDPDARPEAEPDGPAAPSKPASKKPNKPGKARKRRK